LFFYPFNKENLKFDQETIEGQCEIVTSREATLSLLPGSNVQSKVRVFASGAVIIC
jgi:hypothetical protein